MIEKFTQAQGLINNAQNILLATHYKPDADALGSMLALKMGLEKLDKNIQVFCWPAVPGDLHFLPHREHVKTSFSLANIHLIVGLDYGDHKRLGLGSPEVLSQFNFLTLDHHLVGNHLGYCIVEDNFSSTAELVYGLLKFLNLEIDADMATCLLAGILDDTGKFTHPNTSPQTLKNVAELMHKGAPLVKISRLLSAKNLTDDIGVWQKTLDNLSTDQETGLIFSFIDYAHFVELGRDFKTSSVINTLLAIPETKFALMMVERTPGFIDCSLRSTKEKDINVAKIASVFGGGGHYLAAGFSSDKRPSEIIDQIKDLLLLTPLEIYSPITPIA